MVLAATTGISLSSSAGDVKLSAAGSIALNTQAGAGGVSISSSTVTVGSLADSAQPNAAFQVCVCGDGNLYAVPAGALCSSTTCV